MTRSMYGLALLALAALAPAQDMAPPEELGKLSWMFGTWKGSVHMNMQGMEMDADMTVTGKMEGMFARVDTVMDMQGMKMVENGYVGWDAKEKCYKSWTFTNFSSDPRIEKGQLTGDTFVSTSEPWTVMGDTMVGRGTMKKLSDTEIAFVLEFKEGDKWTKAAEGKLKKQ